MSTNLDRDGLSIVQYYRANTKWNLYFECETIYRSRALSGKMRRSSIILQCITDKLNIAKGIARKGVKKDEEINISISDIKIELLGYCLIYLFQTMELTQTCKKIGRFTNEL